jgi:hypothetical protein
MRTLFAVVLSVLAAGCSGNPRVTLVPHEPLVLPLGLPSITELEVSVIDATGRPIEGAEVILQSDPAPRRATTLASGVVRFAGQFLVDPRFFIVCAPSFSCSSWIDLRAAGFGSLHQTVTLQAAAAAIPRLPEPATIRGAVDPPSADFTTYLEGQLVLVSVPSNWRELPGSNAVTFAPEGAYGNAGVKSVFTHCVGIGLARNDKLDLQATTDGFIESSVLAHPSAAVLSSGATIGNRPGLRSVFANVSEATGEAERIEVFTTLLRDGTLLYLLAVAPQDSIADYDAAFRRVVRSIQIIDCDRCVR